MNQLMRVQRKRTKGWQMPANTVSVTRPGKWGNPLKLGGSVLYINAAYRRKHLDPWVVLVENVDAARMIRLFKDIVQGRHFDNADLTYWVNHFKRLDIAELSGHNLACFCPYGYYCHGDVLLELANPAQR